MDDRTLAGAVFEREYWEEWVGEVEEEFGGEELGEERRGWVTRV